MLRLVNIKKNYKVADTEVPALKGISLNFRQSEFVSILGPSGCGKTTLLNIIGGLDKYSSGDLFIDGVSTKNFKDHDWDVYRNHKIGFIFQSYNLIPHQTILGNVELALTISGVSKKERQERAKRALDKVGLKGQYNKKPNQLSGGQCQRVAIARALVNEPSILLADEPTGALDTVTSVQIMELIKEISQEKLVIMVTHNPELAEKYSTRIVRLLDGELQEDSMPYSKEEEEAECNVRKKDEPAEVSKKAGKKRKTARMNLWTAFKLSGKNLISKAKRTIMVALAGCIGIVGISAVLSVRNGVLAFVASMENDVLSGYPVYVSQTALDISSIMGGGDTDSITSINPDNDTSTIYVNSAVQQLYGMSGALTSNTITQEYIDYLNAMPKEACSLVQYKYGYKIAPNLYTDFQTNTGTHKMSVSAIQAVYASVLNSLEDLAPYSSLISSATVMSELPSDAAYLADHYNILYIENGMTLEEVLADKSSIIAVATQAYNTLNDLELAEYGYFSQEKFMNYCYKISSDERYVDNELLNIPRTMSYEDIAKKQFTWYPNDTVFTKDKTGVANNGDKYYASAYADGTLSDSEYSQYNRDAFGDVEGMVNLNVKCVLKLKPSHFYGPLTAGGMYYTSALSEHARKYNYNSEICQSARMNGNELYNIEMGYYFKVNGDSPRRLDTYRLTGGGSSSSTLMSYISTFVGSVFGTGGQKATVSYSGSALGANELPSLIYFYCDDFDQKDKLTAYLDVWNDTIAAKTYKQDSNGYYVGKEVDEKGSEKTVYFYYDSFSDSYYRVNLSKDGYAVDYKGNQYRLKTDPETGSGVFQQKNADGLSDQRIYLDGTITVNDLVSVNAYTLASYVFFGKEFQESNIYYNDLEEVPDKGGNLYRYKNADGNYEYVMRVEKRNYRKVALDKEGNVMAVRDGYERYRYNEADNLFYRDEYVRQSLAPIEETTEETEEIDEEIAQNAASVLDGLDPEYREWLKQILVSTIEENTGLLDDLSGLIREAIYAAIGDALAEDPETVALLRKIFSSLIIEMTQPNSYVFTSTPLTREEQQKLYADTTVYPYANVVKNPKYTVAGIEFTLDTKGLYVDMLQIDMSNLSVNILNRTITFRDYSGIDFYYFDADDVGEKYYYVNYVEEGDEGYLYASSVTNYLSSTSLLAGKIDISSVVNMFSGVLEQVADVDLSETTSLLNGDFDLSAFVSDKYKVNSDGSIQAVVYTFDEDNTPTMSQMIELRILGDKLTDLSILEVDSSKKINYTDNIGMVITMVNMLIKIVSYVLIAFTALSLLVSTVMIGIITYVSVVERTKEIGVIRALGGRKRDVSHLFNAETFIIGLVAGLFGIAITYLIGAIINVIIGSLTGVYTIAIFPFWQAAVMVGVSVVLTLLSGILPSRSAAKKDPVVALRTE